MQEAAITDVQSFTAASSRAAVAASAAATAVAVTKVRRLVQSDKPNGDVNDACIAVRVSTSCGGMLVVELVVLQEATLCPWEEPDLVLTGLHRSTHARASCIERDN